MATCDYCGTTILFGGNKVGDLRFCNNKCESAGHLVIAAKQISDSEVTKHLTQVHQGNRPQCDGAGPVDVHTSHRIWSALFMTSWQSCPNVCCKKCGNKKRVLDTLFSIFLGWWGLPWGIIMTPVQIGKNIFGLIRRVDPETPSDQLENIVRLQLAERNKMVMPVGRY